MKAEGGRMKERPEPHHHAFILHPSSFVLSTTPSLTVAPSASFFPRLRLHGCDCYGVNDVFGFAAARKIVGGFVQALQDGADGGRACETLRQFVSDVARLQVWEDE